MAHTYTKLLYHIVFATHGRDPLIDKRLRPALFAQLGAMFKEERATPLAIGGVADHVHALVGLRADHCVSDVVRAVKSCSTGWVRRTQEGLAHFGWQAGYGAFTISHWDTDMVRRYIENQEQHHASQTLDAEFLELCHQHGVEVDEKTMWD
jgi:REP element-mobilizing transposase RayT